MRMFTRSIDPKDENVQWHLVKTFKIGKRTGRCGQELFWFEDWLDEGDPPAAKTCKECLTKEKER